MPFMELTKKESYAIQIGNYLANGQFQEASSLAEEMVKKFPAEPLSHFMAAKSYYLSGQYEKSYAEGRKAFNLSSLKPDLLVSAIVTASALFMLGQYAEAYKLVSPFKNENNEEVKKLMLILSMVMKNGVAAAEYYKELHDLNRAAAERFVRKLAGLEG